MLMLDDAPSCISFICNKTLTLNIYPSYLLLSFLPVVVVVVVVVGVAGALWSAGGAIQPRSGTCHRRQTTQRQGQHHTLPSPSSRHHTSFSSNKYSPSNPLYLTTLPPPPPPGLSDLHPVLPAVPADRLVRIHHQLSVLS